MLHAPSRPRLFSPSPSQSQIGHGGGGVAPCYATNGIHARLVFGSEIYLGEGRLPYLSGNSLPDQPTMRVYARTAEQSRVEQYLRAYRACTLLTSGIRGVKALPSSSNPLLAFQVRAVCVRVCVIQMYVM